MADTTDTQAYVIDEIRKLLSPHNRATDFGLYGAGALGLLMVVSGLALAIYAGGPALYLYLTMLGAGEFHLHVRLIRYARRIGFLLDALSGRFCRCEYELTGNTSGACPECGIEIARSPTSSSA